MNEYKTQNYSIVKIKKYSSIHKYLKIRVSNTQPFRMVVSSRILQQCVETRKKNDCIQFTIK